MPGFFRYPGGKSKIKKFIIEKILLLIQQNNLSEYAEPFMGGGSIFLDILKTNIDKFQINDKDYGIYSIWYCIQNYSNEIIERIETYRPKIKDFYSFKEDLINKKEDVIITAFKKIVLHQISFSGLGIKAGGPIGGIKQQSKYTVDCRWSQNRLIKFIKLYNDIFSKKNIKITNLSFDKLNFNKKTIVYLDPPYFHQGNQLYYCGFTLEDHEKLKEYFDKIDYPVLSYDNHPFIRDMYKKYSIDNLTIKYTINTIRNVTELLICK